MTASEFKKKWVIKDNDLRTFPKHQVDKLSISDTEKEFLYLSGLPYNCAPFIGFGDLDNTQLEKLVDVWGLNETFDDLFLIGHNGAGDPICLEDKTGLVLLFNHDADFDEIFVNSSISKLAQFLLLTRELISDINQKFGSDAVWDDNMAVELKMEYREKLHDIDENAIEPGNFWNGFVRKYNDC